MAEIDVSALLAFIEERLTSDEAHAKKDLHLVDRASNGGVWEYGLGYNLPYSELGEGGSIGRLTATYGRPLADGEPDQHNADAMLVARMVRAARPRAERMLREVEAKRRLLDDLTDTPHQLIDEWWSCRSIDFAYWNLRGELRPSGEPCSCGRDDDVLRRLRLFAVPYADHPDFRAAWLTEENTDG